MVGKSINKAIKQRNIDIDLLKGISIIAVVLYHMGVLKSGYLGVDCFFVISGFFTLSKIIKDVQNGSFKFIKFIRGRVVRLLPSILLVSFFSLIIGFFLWLPNDYENLAETVIASNVFSNNILAGITTKNYWDAINEYKPLMHMWYVGILMEYYVLLPVIVIILYKIAGILRKDQNKTILTGIGIVTVFSFVLFLLPFFSAGDKFYFIPFRFWELSIGGFAGIYSRKCGKKAKRQNKQLSILSFVIMLAILSIGMINFDASRIGVATTIVGADSVASSDLILPNSILLIFMVFVTCVFLVTDYKTSAFNKSTVLSTVGRRSFSIFVWHQTMLAIYRYSVSNKVSLPFVLSFFVSLVIISELNYRIIENRIKDSNRNIVVLLIFSVVICTYSGIIFLRAGVVRDVPELGVSTTDIQRNMHSRYCDRIYSYKDEFLENGKINVMVIGNSFARDWGNVLLESSYGNQINLFFNPHFTESLMEKIKVADRIFVFENYENKVPEYVWENVDKDIVYCIGTKNFGTSNGTIYAHRFSEGYYSQTVALDPGYKALNTERQKTWGDHYVELIEPVLINGRVRVFTDDNMFISQDCRHLTEAGARYYAKILNLSQYMP